MYVRARTVQQSCCELTKVALCAGLVLIIHQQQQLYTIMPQTPFYLFRSPIERVGPAYIS